VSISSITTNTTTPLQGVAGHQHHRGGKPRPLDATAQLLGVSADELSTQLKSGKTLNDLASDKGVSSADLLSALKTDLKAHKPADAPELSDDQLTQMATGIAAGTGPRGPGGPGGPPPVSSGANDDATKAEANLKQLAESLGVSQSDLLDKLTAGVNFSSLLGSASTNPYTASAHDLAGGVAVDEYA
jgi:hypothetical protein